MRKKIIGVMGPGEKAQPADIENAQELGRLIAEQGWILLSGGGNKGVMDAVNKGAKEAGGLTLGIMPNLDLSDMSEAVDIPVVTNMSSARNNINVLTSNVVVACGLAAGTASEIALALKAKKSVILLSQPPESQALFKLIGQEKIFIAQDPADVIKIAQEVLEQDQGPTDSTHEIKI